MGHQFTVEDAPDLTIPEDIVVPARLEDLVFETVEYTDRKTNLPASFDKLIWWFEVTGSGQYAGRKIKGETDAKVNNHPRNKFRQWAETLLGRELPVGMGIDTDDLVGLSGQITVRHEPDRKDKDKVWERIEDVFPIDAGAFDEPPF